MVKHGSSASKTRTRAKAAQSGLSYQQQLTRTTAPSTAGHTSAPPLKPAQLIGFCGHSDPHLTQMVAENIGAAWAAQGRRVLVFRHTRHPDAPIWPRRARTDGPTAVRLFEEPQPLRATDGPGALDACTLRVEHRRYDDIRNVTSATLDSVKAGYDHVLLVSKDLQPLPDLAEVYVALPVDDELPTGEERWVIDAGRRTLRTFPYDAGQSAVIWRDRLLRLMNVDWWPLAGLIVMASPRPVPTAPWRFVRAVEDHMRASGTPILGRLPRVQLGLPHAALPLPVLDKPNSRISKQLCSAADALHQALPFLEK
ncbi:hypothetical protein ACWGCC_03700 [Streptomyces nigrescens]